MELEKEGGAAHPDLATLVAEAAKRMGYAHLQEQQEEAVKLILGGKDTFVALPTGFGKSVIYAVLPLAFDMLQGNTTGLIYSYHCVNTGTTGSIVICISPLTSIMMDQREKYADKGLRTEFVGQAQEDEMATRRVVTGQVQLVYISPEALLRNNMYRHMLLSDAYKKKLVAIAVDEAHCITTW